MPDLASRPAASGRMAHIEQSTTDKLGKHIDNDTSLVNRLGLLGALRHRQRSDWGSLDRITHHRAHRILRHYRAHGVPVTLADPPWTRAELDAAISRGPHKSAYEYAALLREDMSDMIDKAFWMVIPYDLVKHHPSLRLSPISVVPQNNRRPRPIVDYTFYGVNASTQPNVPTESMQFGRTLDRLIRRIVTANPRYGRVYLSKTDLSDGFYRVRLSPRDIVKLGVPFPSGPGEPPLVALPLCLPMGWKNSPPGFSAATETIADITNRRLLHMVPESPHPLDDTADTPPDVPPPHTDLEAATAVPLPPRVDPHLARYRRRRLAYVDIYVDDFIGAAQGRRKHLLNVRRTLFHTIDSVFRPLVATDPPSRKAPISVKKLLAGDAAWSTSKEVLGWLLNTQHMTLRLTPRRTARLTQLLFSDFPPHRKCATLPEWHKLLGELRSMTLALPGASGLHHPEERRPRRSHRARPVGQPRPLPRPLPRPSHYTPSAIWCPSANPPERLF